MLAHQMYPKKNCNYHCERLVVPTLINPCDQVHAVQAQSEQPKLTSVLYQVKSCDTNKVVVG